VREEVAAWGEAAAARGEAAAEMEGEEEMEGDEEMAAAATAVRGERVSAAAAAAGVATVRGRQRVWRMRGRLVSAEEAADLMQQEAPVAMGIPVGRRLVPRGVVPSQSGGIQVH
jgi:hypothetical protein